MELDPLISEWFPLINKVVVKRPVEEVKNSLKKLDLPSEGFLENQAAWLDRVSKQPGTLTVEYKDLQKEETCKEIFERCLATSFDKDWWDSLKNKRVMVDIPALKEKVQANYDEFIFFQKEVAEEMTHRGELVCQ